MMLPEHKEILKEMWNKQDQPNRPLLDEQQLDDLNNRLSVAYAERRSVQITYVVEKRCGERSEKCQAGVITNIYPETKRIEIGGVSIELQYVTSIDVQ